MASFLKICLLLTLFVALSAAVPHPKRESSRGIGHWFTKLCLTLKRCPLYATCKRYRFSIYCECPKRCPQFRYGYYRPRPVCGTDGKTYNSVCELKRKTCLANGKTKVRFFRACKTTTQQSCAAVTCSYYATCKVKNNRATCVCNRGCSRILRPVCGTDGKIYNNLCLLRVKSCTTKTMIKVKSCKGIGQCFNKRCPLYATCKRKIFLTYCECPKRCPLRYFRWRRVCGTDGKTYNSVCDLKRKTCLANKKTRVRFFRACPNPCLKKHCCCGGKCEVTKDNKAICKCQTICNARHNPVCGSDGVTYSNFCKLRVAACQQQNTRLFVQYHGTCITTTEPPTLSPCATIKCGYYATCDVTENGTAKCVCNEACPKNLRPVCGSDNVTYDNECLLELESCTTQTTIEVQHDGPCIEITSEPPTLSPCATIKCGYYATCEVTENGTAKCVCNEACPKIYSPVCGSDNVTYPNECLLKLESCKTQTAIEVQHDGPCIEITTEPPTLSPCATIKCGYYATCKVTENGTAKCVCNEACPKIYSPVCGSDNVTYPNECLLKVESCKTQTTIEVQHDGPCVKITTEPPTLSPCATIKCGYYATCDVTENGTAKCVCNEACPKIYSPVCGSDNVTYPNECLLKLESCTTQTTIEVQHDGPCIEITTEPPTLSPCTTIKCGYYATCKVTENGTAKCVCNEACPKIYSPVCGSDNVTYDNECLLKLESCTTQTAIEVQHDGPCIKITTEPPTLSPCATIKCRYYATCEVTENGTAKCVCNEACPEILSPVCGTDGVTYDNECLLKLESCTTQTTIGVQHDGPCIEITTEPPTLSPCTTIKCGYYATCEVTENGTAKCVCNEACPKIYSPVCGSDNATYPNECLLKLESCTTQTTIEVQHDGPCIKITTEPPTLSPCATIKCGYYATCDVTENGTAKCVCNEACPKIYSPVCGSDNVTYPNECLLKVESCKTQTTIEVQHDGPCVKITTEPPTLSPCTTIKCGYYATCEVTENGTAKCVCNEACPEILSPVCGTDGVTYGNECLLKLESCTTQTTIGVQHDGPCIKITTEPPTLSPCATIKCGYYATCDVTENGTAKCACNEACPKIYSPVCGSDNVTYSNECLLKVESCKTQTTIEVQHDGPCKKRCPKGSSTACFAPCSVPVCAQSGKYCCCTPGDPCESCTVPVNITGRSACPKIDLLCLSDSDCADDHECCSNGCVKTCMPKAG